MNTAPKPHGIGGKARQVSRKTLVKSGPLNGSGRAPFEFKAAVPGLELAPWLEANRSIVAENLQKYGAILFRGFARFGADVFETIIETESGGALIEYVYGSTPRTRIKGKIYTATEYPANEAIALHNEMSYTNAWPMRLWFCCIRPADKGGDTLLADSRRILHYLDGEVCRKFAGKGVMYVRNYTDNLDVSWQQVFETADPVLVASHCAAAGIEHEWRGDGSLRTRQVCQGIGTHPVTGEQVWFNQAHLFHASNLKTEVRESLLRAVGHERLPRNAFYGDGSEIEPRHLQKVREAYAREAFTVSWRAGDVLLLDNMLMAHGRAPFDGARRIQVGMSQPYKIQPEARCDEIG